MNMNNKLTTAGVLVAIVLGTLGLFTGDTVVNNPVTKETIVGAAPGPDLTERTTTLGGFAQAGVTTVATTSSTYTLTDRQLAFARIINVSDMGAGQAALTLTLPASSTWASLPRVGHSQSWIVDNLPATAATTTTITAGTGVDIDGTTANDDVINGGVSGTLTCWRLPNTDVRCIVEEMVDAG